MKKIKEYIIITIGIILGAIAMEYFFFPNEIASGGVSGLALVINDMFGISTGMVMILSNVILFIIAFILLGGEYGIKSIYASFGLSFILSFIEETINPVAITDNVMLASIFGSALLSFGTALVFSQGASTGGTSIIASILNKYLHINIGKGLFIADAVVIILAIYAFGIELALFGLLAIYLSSTLVDKFIDGFNSCKQVYIFTNGEEEKIKEYIKKDINRGCTVFRGVGGYSGEENTLIFTVLNRKEFIRLRKYLKDNNSSAFVSVNEASEVLGKGFTSL